jgi:hypothetical protein
MSPPTLARRMRHAGLTVLAALTLAAAPATAATGHASARSHAAARPSSAVRRACPAPTRRHQMACLSLVRTDVTAHHGIMPQAAPSGLGAADLRNAYALPSSSAGSGQTVAIVDAYDDPNAEADLATYRSQYGLPACTSASGCFKKVGQTGGSALPTPDPGWAEEESLDLDMVSAVCPNCHILLVEASQPTTHDLGTAVNTAIRLGAGYVSNSYGGSESPSDPASDSAFFNHPGVAITVAAGDSGYGVMYPAASQYVTAVGGTTLSRASSARGWSETVWSGTGSGCSAYDAKPSWQHDTGCSRRTVADVSAVADPGTGVAVYDTYRTGGWLVIGGTSASAPVIAGAYALAGPPPASSYPASLPYAHTGALNDIRDGGNGSCGPSYLCTAGTGYDGPSGLGTPGGAGAFHSGTGEAAPLAAGAGRATAARSRTDLTTSRTARRSP